MASSQSTSPVVPDGGKKDEMSWHRAADNCFVWVASSPSPAEIYELERRFSEVVQVPVRALEEEADGWEKLTVIAQSLSRWVPSEAIIREFRRAGISGDIEVVSLAHRHYLFQFADPLAKAQVLGKPWVANGQIIAMIDWRPEFVPSEQSLLSALLWIRLPVLSIEFWAEEVLSSIVSVAGDFLFLDSSTKERQRGGYARACVRVDLSRPLRPGARIRGCGAPFWKQFVYEHLDRICGSCGSLHPSDSCDSAVAADSPLAALVFGPWMAALRHRRVPQAPSVASGKEVHGSPGLSSASAEGWQTPRKIARRKPGRVPAAPVPTIFSVVPKGSESPGVGAVPELQRLAPQVGSSCGGQESAASLKVPVSGMGACRSKAGVPVDAEGPGLSVSTLPQFNLDIAPNPFVLLGSDKWAGRSKVRSDAYPGPLKWAQPVETPV